MTVHISIKTDLYTIGIGENEIVRIVVIGQVVVSIGERIYLIKIREGIKDSTFFNFELKMVVVVVT